HAKKKGKVNDIAMLYLAETVTRNGKTKKIKGRFSTRLFDLKVQQDIYPDCVIIDPIKLKGQGNPIVCTLNGGASVQIGIHIDNSGCSNNVMVATRLSRFRSWLRKPSKENAIIRKLKTGENGGTDGNKTTNGTTIESGNLTKNGSGNGTTEGGNGTTEGGNGTIHGGNGTTDGGNGTINGGNGTTDGGNNGTTTGNYIII
ncbi:uncharacterized protein LOC132739102, partial [Ruditapes philippinarum]|uniref:uncharacterized protein LOC132739102 n=1 Tax=Ruditapes philippinarum TaxID=129788 RepID=UPI00295BD2D6